MCPRRGLFMSKSKSGRSRRCGENSLRMELPQRPNVPDLRAGGGRGGGGECGPGAQSVRPRAGGRALSRVSHNRTQICPPPTVYGPAPGALWMRDPPTFPTRRVSRDALRLHFLLGPGPRLRAPPTAVLGAPTSGCRRPDRRPLDEGTSVSMGLRLPPSLWGHTSAPSRFLFPFGSRILVAHSRIRCPRAVAAAVQS